MGSDVVVSVPARPEFVHILRTVAAGVAAQADFTFDEIDDLRLAVDEAIGHLLGAGRGGRQIVVRLSTEDARVEVEASIDAPTDPWPPADAEASLTWQVLSALTDEAKFDRSAHGPALLMVKRRASA